MPLFEPDYLAKQYWFLTWYGYLGYEESYWRFDGCFGCLWFSSCLDSLYLFVNLSDWGPGAQLLAQFCQLKHVASNFAWSYRATPVCQDSIPSFSFDDWNISVTDHCYRTQPQLYLGLADLSSLAALLRPSCYFEEIPNEWSEITMDWESWMLKIVETYFMLPFDLLVWQCSDFVWRES